MLQDTGAGVDITNDKYLLIIFSGGFLFVPSQSVAE